MPNIISVEAQYAKILEAIRGTELVFACKVRGIETKKCSRCGLPFPYFGDSPLCYVCEQIPNEPTSFRDIGERTES
jgi:uncharacterized metal-binding protein YceD (DUF177 family)